MRLSDFDFDLPQGLIATRPARPRSSARLLVAGPDRIDDLRVLDLPAVLRPGDRLVLNDTRVIPARLEGTRRRGEAVARIAATLLSDRGEGLWTALLKPLRKLREGEAIDFGGGLSATFEGAEAGQGLLRFALSPDAFAEALARAGRMPLPPYIEALRPADDHDCEDYQTVWAARAGAVAAPTASLHFDEPLLAALRARGVDFTHVTLHVGAGTFLPVKVDDIAEHRMHAEWGEVTGEAAAEIAATRRAGGRVIPVGTTALRLIESAARGGDLRPWRGETDIFITPGFEFRVADGLMTNFHLPRSTLMMLVSALMGLDRVRAIYAHAIAERYRFFSYGDASLLLP
ncbi:tRNA preQ1(34) S-adenosylmethionine ribosyltransferase-isomerase QueA [Rubellimicrobium aerolatum]|uniref:S-adenosylmethionine:tRNA ribosyltransferase-isomerase n=1 Tax=Rubellimicrobium aerolatum TaxID=490979 RepID=A0ABW0SBV7_9RHOB|nr:tRNA preQ1(34) S-adenosylmethionine ribosyltransferase-isomerase QueA [Rubellimicrobium aerolatum]MBP1805971.1 S-adenosylmethionine:tRNA ribosyltransferase-isomerase [Rubellimicrobium aerolatum]